MQKPVSPHLQREVEAQLLTLIEKLERLIKVRVKEVEFQHGWVDMLLNAEAIFEVSRSQQHANLQMLTNLTGAWLITEVSSFEVRLGVCVNHVEFKDTWFGRRAKAVVMERGGSPLDEYLHEEYEDEGT